MTDQFDAGPSRSAEQHHGFWQNEAAAPEGTAGYVMPGRPAPSEAASSQAGEATPSEATPGQQEAGTPKPSPEAISKDTELGKDQTVRTEGGTQVDTDPNGRATVNTGQDTKVTVNADGSVAVVTKGKIDSDADSKAGGVRLAEATSDGQTKTTLSDDGTYKLADGTKIKIADGVVTVTDSNGDKVVTEDGKTKVDLVADDTFEKQDMKDAAKAAEEKAKAEAEEAKKEAEEAANAGGGSPSGGGGAPSGGGSPSGGGGSPSGGGGSPSGGGGGAPAGGGSPGGGAGGTEAPQGAGSKDNIEVSPAALRSDAKVWASLQTDYTAVGSQVEGLTIDTVDFGAAALMASGYERIRAEFGALVTSGSESFQSISDNLMRNADDYELNEQNNADLATSGTAV